MNMNRSKRVDKYFNRKSKTYWHFYHLKKDVEFKKEAADLANRISIHYENGDIYLPDDIKDFDILSDHDKYKKLVLVNKFMERWNIYWDKWLLAYLIRGKEDFIPDLTPMGVGAHLDEKRNMFVAQIPISARKEDLALLWEIMELERARVGYVLKPRMSQDILTESSTEIAYQMWKLLRDGATWPNVLKRIEKKKIFDNKSTAERYLRSNGFVPEIVKGN